MTIEIFWPERKKGELEKKHIIIETNNFDLINQLDSLTDYTKLKNILNIFEHLYTIRDVIKKTDMRLDLYTEHFEKFDKMQKAFESKNGPKTL